MPVIIRQTPRVSTGICAYCGDYADQMDHVIPRSFARRLHPNVTVQSCQPCNLAARDLVFPDFESKKRYILIRQFIGKAESESFREVCGAFHGGGLL